MTSHALTTLSSSTATKLTPNGTHGGMDITIQNTDGSAYVYIGVLNSWVMLLMKSFFISESLF